MDAVVRQLHPGGPEGPAGTLDDASVADIATPTMGDADRQAYWDDLAALRARLAELRAG